MGDEKKGQDARVKFYNSGPVIRYLKTAGIPKRTGEFRAMVAAGSNVKLEDKEGLELIETLGRVVFAKHPQQINVSDDTNGKIIVSVAI
jgi:3-dehydroquinate synthase class II